MKGKEFIKMQSGGMLKRLNSLLPAQRRNTLRFFWGGQKDSCARGGKLRIATGDAKTREGETCPPGDLRNTPPLTTWQGRSVEAGKDVPQLEGCIKPGARIGTRGRCQEHGIGRGGGLGIKPPSLGIAPS